MQTVLFVDDDRNTLAYYQKLVEGKKSRWRALFADNAGDAVTLLEQHYIDIIISDLEMPVVNGTILLQHVKKISPQTIRIIISGCHEDTAIMESLKLAHRVLPKPGSFEELTAILNRSYYLHHITLNHNARKTLMNVSSLPAAPSVINEITIALEDENCSLQDVANIISNDITMSVNILRIINSPYFRLPNQIVSIHQAIPLLGVDIIRSLIITLHFFDSFTPEDSTILDELLKHSTNCAHYCRDIFTYERRPKEECDAAFITGFMHDLGKLIFTCSFPDKYDEYKHLISIYTEMSSDLEKRLFGSTHSETGAFLLGLWGFDEEIIEAVAFHHNPLEAQCESPLLLAVLHCADIFEYEIRVPDSIEHRVPLSVEFLEREGLLDREEIWLGICQKSKR